MEPSLLDQYLGHEVVIDVVPPYVYLGRLTGHDAKWLVLEAADVHDLRDSTTTRENYVVDSRRLGIRINRKQALVNAAEVVSISRLDEVIV